MRRKENRIAVRAFMVGSLRFQKECAEAEAIACRGLGRGNKPRRHPSYLDRKNGILFGPPSRCHVIEGFSVAGCSRRSFFLICMRQIQCRAHFPSGERISWKKSYPPPRKECLSEPSRSCRPDLLMGRVWRRDQRPSKQEQSRPRDPRDEF